VDYRGVVSMLSDTALDAFIRDWQKAMNEHRKLGYPRANILWKAGRGNSRMTPPTEEDSYYVELFVNALRGLGFNEPHLYRAFMAKYADYYDGVIDHRVRKDKEKAGRLGVPKSTFGRHIERSRAWLKEYLENNFNT